MPRQDPSRLVGWCVAAAALVLVLLVSVAAAPAGAVVGGPIARGPQVPVNPEADPDRSRDHAREILAGGEYQEPVEADRGLPDRIRRWIADRMPDLDLDGEGASSPMARILSWLLVGVLLAGTVVVVVRGLLHARTTREPARDPDAEVEVLPLRDPSEWEAEAARCRDAGDHRGEVRAWFRATTTALEDRSLLPSVPGRTARELVEDLTEAAPPAGATFDALGHLFEEAWYGGSAVGPEDGDRAADLSARTLAAAGRRARPRDVELPAAATSGRSDPSS